MQEIEDKLKKADMGFEVGDTQKLESQYSKLGRKLDSLIKKQQDLNKSDLSNLRKNIDNVGNGITRTISKVGKWALAVFAIESAYGAVRNAMSTLSQYDDQMQSNLQYIQYALANALKPLIETILNLVVKLLQYVNYISQAWFGINLFSGAKEFKSMADSSKKTAKNIKETKKSLVGGIDEITNLDMNQENNNSNIGTDTGMKMPSFDLSNMDGQVPTWLKWIADNKDIILSVIAGITAGLLAWKLGLGGIQSLGIGIAIAGIVYTIKSIIEFLKNPTWENFGKVITGIGITVAGVAIAFGAWPIVIAGVLAAVVGFIITHWDKVKEILGKAVEWIKEKFSSIISFFSNLISKIVSLFKMIGTTVGNVIYGAFKAVVNGIMGVIESILNSPIKTVNKLIKVINSVPGINLGVLPTFKLPRLAKGGIVNNPGKGVNMGSYVAGERGAEAILPLQNSKFISDFAGEVASQMGNNDINTQLLIDLNKNILELANQPIYFNVNGKELAQATYEDYENEGKRKQKSATVVRS